MASGEPLPARVPVQTITGRTGVIVATEGALFVVEHGDGTRQAYAEQHLHYAPTEPGALYLDMGRFAEHIELLRVTR